MHDATVSRDFTPVAPFESSLKDIGSVSNSVIVDGEPGTLSISEYLERTRTDSFLVLHKGKLVYETYFNGMQGFSYRDQYWHLGNRNRAFTAMGVFGQYIYIDPVAEVVIVKQSSDVKPLTDFAASNSFAALAAVANHFVKN